MEPRERLLSSLAGAGLARERDATTESKWGSAQCPVCDKRGGMWYTAEGELNFGCRERCDRSEVMEMLGLEHSDLITNCPAWLQAVIG